MAEVVRVKGQDGSYITALREDVDRFTLMADCSRVFITNPTGDYLLQLRATGKSVFRNHWDFGIAETSRPGESDQEVAIRGLKEELGLQNVQMDELRHLGQFVYDSIEIKRRVSAYLFVYDEQRHGPIRPEAGEVAEVKFVKPAELGTIIADAMFSPVGKYAYRKIICPEKTLYTN